MSKPNPASKTATKVEQIRRIAFSQSRPQYIPLSLMSVQTVTMTLSLSCFGQVIDLALQTVVVANCGFKSTFLLWQDMNQPGN
jgi:hypothetical protein